MNYTLSTDQETKLAEAFKNFSGSQTKSANVGVAQAFGTLDFCNEWPRARQVLVFISALPVVPQAIKDAIAIVISGGDTVSNVICN